jgi:hypothetical protein
MATMTRNSTISQSVICIGGLLMCVGLFLEPTKTLFSVGYSLLWFGMIQSYYGSILEIENSNRGWWVLLGLPLTIGVAYVSYLNLRDNLQNWYWIVAVVLATLLLQLIISFIASKHFSRVKLLGSIHQNRES